MLPAHCEVTGHTEARIGRGGQNYAIRSHLHLPQAWNGDFFFQSGGSDGELGRWSRRSGRGGTLAFGFDPLARANYDHASLCKSVEAAKAAYRRLKPG